ncbi:MAG: DUF4112 domain-containing protein [Planctomycetales bacterium]
MIADPERWRSVDEDLELLARWMDSVFEIPGTGIRFGLDAIIGLVPGIGDALTSLVSMYILKVAARRGVPRVVLVRMTINLAIDYLAGSLPIVGDAFDVYWKANVKNVELLRRHAVASPSAAGRGSSSDWLFVGGLIAGLVTLLVGCGMLAYFLVTGAWHAITT